MSKNSLVLFILGVLVGAAGTWFLKPEKSTAPATSEVSPNAQNGSSQNCPTTPAATPSALNVEPCLANTPAKLLEPPTFAPEMPKEFQGNFEGEIRVSWIRNPEATRTRVIVTNPRGKRLKTFSTKGQSVVIKDLPRDPQLALVEFKVTLASVNADDKEGALSESRRLTIKGKPELIAPKIKTIQVED